MISNVLLTGANGFLGRQLAESIFDMREISLTATLRRNAEVPAARVIRVQGLDESTDWLAALEGQEVVIHAAARAHITKDDFAESMTEYRRVNVDGTLNLARQAAMSGVRRFVFISSIGVNGDINVRPFSENDVPNPAGLYAQSKWEAEQGLWKVQSETGMELVIIRPPLVYGANPPGNFGSLIRLIASGVPLPLGAIHNQRSLVAVDNLVDLIITCIVHPAAANQVFFAGDGQDISTTELVRGIAEAMGKPARLIPIPSALLFFGATLLGQKAITRKLLGSLQVDISKARNLLGWEPPVSVAEGLRRCFGSE